jgi:hypothetical protein
VRLQSFAETCCLHVQKCTCISALPSSRGSHRQRPYITFRFVSEAGPSSSEMSATQPTVRQCKTRKVEAALTVARHTVSNNMEHTPSRKAYCCLASQNGSSAYTTHVHSYTNTVHKSCSQLHKHSTQIMFTATQTQYTTPFTATQTQYKIMFTATQTQYTTLFTATQTQYTTLFTATQTQYTTLNTIH